MTGNTPAEIEIMGLFSGKKPERFEKKPYLIENRTGKESEHGGTKGYVSMPDNQLRVYL